MPKIRDFDRVTALYERLSKDDERDYPILCVNLECGV